MRKLAVGWRIQTGDLHDFIRLATTGRKGRKPVRTDAGEDAGEIKWLLFTIVCEASRVPAMILQNGLKR